MASNRVFDLFQDSLGYIWFCTDRGINRFNGLRFETYNSDSGLTSGTVFKAECDSKGRIWFATYSSDLFYFEHGKLNAYYRNSEIHDVSPKHAVKSGIYFDKNGSIMLGTTRNGLMTIESDGKIAKKKFHFNGTLTEKEGNLLAIGNSFYNEGDSIVLAYDDLDKKKIRSKKIPKDKVGIYGSTYSLKNESYILYSFKNVLSIITDHSWEIIYYKNSVDCIFQDSYGKIWISEIDGGVYQYDNLKELRSSLPSDTFFHKNTVTDILEDDQGGFWFSTLNDGVYYSPSINVNSATYLTGKTIWDFAECDSSVFALCSDGSIWKIQEKDVSAVAQISLDNTLPIETSIACDEQDKTLVVGELPRNVHAVSKNEIEGVPIEMFEESLEIDWKGLQSFTTSDIMVIDGIRYYAMRDSLLIKNDKEQIGLIVNPEIKPLCLSKAGKNQILIGTLEGPYKLVRGNLEAIVSGEQGKFRVDGILDWGLDTILCVGQGSGVILLAKDSVIKISTRNGLNSNNITCLARDGDFLWIGTDLGISRMCFLRGQVVIDNYSYRTGLVPSNVSNLSIRYNSMLIGASNGINRIEISRLEKLESRINIVIERIQVNNKNVLNKILKLPHDQNNLRINFCGLEFKEPENIIYQIKMSGLHADWKVVPEKEISYYNLTNGRYEFQIRAKKPFGGWSYSEVIDINITPPFYSTLWFFVICIVTLSLSLYYLIKAWIRHKNSKLQMELELSETKFKILQAQLNPHLVFNSLNSLYNFSLNHTRDQVSVYILKFADYLRNVLTNSTYQTIELAKEVESIQSYLELEKMRFKDKLNYKLIIEPQLLKSNKRIPVMLLQPYIENAIKHGINPMNEESHILISMSLNHKYLMCEVSDNGVGINSNKKRSSSHSSLGMVLNEARLKHMAKKNGGRFKIEITKFRQHENYPGTKVIITFPLKM